MGQHQSLLSPPLSSRAKQTAKRLFEFAERYSSLKKTPEGEKKEKEKRAFKEEHEKLLNLCMEDLIPCENVTEDELIIAFARGAIRCGHYHRTGMGRMPLKDTCGSVTIDAFRTDFTSADLPILRNALSKAFGLDERTLKGVESALEPELRQLEKRLKVMEAMAQIHPLKSGSPQETLSLFSALFPGHPLRSEEISVVRTGSCITFCIPYDEDGLICSEPERRQSQFIRKITGFQQEYNSHFPSFGFFHASKAEEGLISKISGVSGLEENEVIQTLTPALVILPKAEVDKYIVHDVWGHQWQALLFDFETQYQKMAAYKAPPAADQFFGGVNLEKAMKDPSLWDSYLRECTSTRLHDTLSALNAEIFADAVEHKHLVQNPAQRDLMPSSSFVKDFPAKLDLTLHDLPFYYNAALRSIEKLCKNADLQQNLAAELSSTARNNFQHFLNHTEKWLSNHSPEGSMGKTAINYGILHAHFNHTMAEMEKECFATPFRDLLIFSCASFFEENWSKNFWRLDEHLRQFSGLFRRFDSAFSEIKSKIH